MQWLMLQQDQPEDFVIATGVQHTVREFIDMDGRRAGAHPALRRRRAWTSTASSSVSRATRPRRLKAGDCIVRVDPRYFRPTEVETLLGDPTKAKERLGWVPEITVQEMCAEMVAAGPARARGATPSSRPMATMPAGRPWRIDAMPRDAGPDPLRRRPSRHGRLGHRAPPAAPWATPNLLTASHAELDLTRPGRGAAPSSPTNAIDQVYLAAAKVGGIHANNTYPADFIYDNLMIEANLIQAAHARRACRSCCSSAPPASTPSSPPSRWPKTPCSPAPLEPTNEPYAIAKIAGIKLCESYNRQYGRDYRSVMPTNLYGPGRQLPPREQPRHPRPAAALPRGRASRRRPGDHLGQRHPAARIPACRRHGRRLRARDGAGAGKLPSPHPAHAVPHQRRHRQRTAPSASWPRPSPASPASKGGSTSTPASPTAPHAS